jgi:hypothetical protein
MCKDKIKKNRDQKKMLQGPIKNKTQLQSTTVFS